MTAPSLPGMRVIIEAEEAFRKVPEEHRGLSFERTLSSFAPNDVSRKFELALAIEWARLNDSSQKEILASILCRKTDSPKHPNGLKKVKRRDQLVAASVIQWLGTRVGESFLKEAFRSAGGNVTITYPTDE